MALSNTKTKISFTTKIEINNKQNNSKSGQMLKKENINWQIYQLPHLNKLGHHKSYKPSTVFFLIYLKQNKIKLYKWRINKYSGDCRLNLTEKEINLKKQKQRTLTVLFFFFNLEQKHIKLYHVD